MEPSIEERVNTVVAQVEHAVEKGEYRVAKRLAEDALALLDAPRITPELRARIFLAAGTTAYHSQDFPEAIRRLSIAVDLRENATPSVELADSLRELGAAYRSNGQLSDAEARYDRAREILVALEPEGGKRTATILNNLAVLYYHQSRIAESEERMRESLSLRERLLGPADALVGQTRTNLGELLLAQGRLQESERELEAGLRIREAALPEVHPDIAASLNNLAVLHYERGEYAKADKLQRRVVAIDTTVYGAGSLEVSLDLQNLAEIKARQRRLDEAEQLHRRVLAIRRERLPATHPDLALTLSNLGNVLGDMDRAAEATEAYREALSIDESIAGGKPSLAVASDLNNAADLLRRQGHVSEALIDYQRALAIVEALGGEGRLRTTLMNNVADAHERLGNAADAESFFRQTIEMRRRVLPPDHPDAAHSLSRLASFLGDAGSLDESLGLSGEARGIVAGRIARQDIGDAVDATITETRASRDVLLTHASLLVQSSADENGEISSTAAEELLATLQLLQTTETTMAISRMANRHELRDDAGASALSQLRELRRERMALEQAVLDATASPETSTLNVALDGYRAKLQAIDSACANLTGSIEPHLRRLLSFEQVKLADLVLDLEQKEAVLTTVVGSRFVLLVFLDRTRVQARVEYVAEKDLGAIVKRVRQSVDLSGGMASLPPFDDEAARRLYDIVIAPFEDCILGLQHLVYVPSGVLEGIPLAILPSFHSDESRWLGDRLPATTIPSIASFHAVRHRAGRSAAQEPFIGFGAPDLQSTASTAGLGDLPRALEQLEAICEGVEGDISKIIVGKGATRSAVKDTDLRRYKVVAFATHGLVSEEAEGLGGSPEPSLLLSQENGDIGLLSASEIASLSMDADWVILSACNSAAPEGRFGAEGLSGLARAFFDAGARTLLVSHWPVSEWTTTWILEELFSRLAVDATMSRAQALSLAMQYVRARGLPEHSHPAFWGAFVVVGEGLWR